MSTRMIRVLLCDPDDVKLDEITLNVEQVDYGSDLDVRKQIAEHIEQEGRFYIYEEDSIFAVEERSYNYLATVLPLLAFVDRCPHCGDQSEETLSSARIATDRGGRGLCTQCGIAFRIARM